MAIKKVGVIGGGLMGAGIATRFALAGYSMVVLEANEARIPQIPQMVKDILAELVDAELITSLVSAAALSRVTVTSDITMLQGAEIVIEAIPEVLELKQELYTRLESVLGEEVLIASNTSGLLPDALCAGMARKERFLIAHFWNPPHAMPLVEVVPGSHTASGALDRMVDVLREIKADPVVLNTAIPGFIGNRLQFAVLREALNIVRSGAADPETVDAVMKASLGRRYSIIGPFEGADLGGLGTFLTIAFHLMPQLAKDEEVLDLLRSHTEKGNLGASTGQGFYHWDESRYELIRSKRRQQLANGKVEPCAAPAGAAGN